MRCGRVSIETDGRVSIGGLFVGRVERAGIRSRVAIDCSQHEFNLAAGMNPADGLRARRRIARLRAGMAYHLPDMVQRALDAVCPRERLSLPQVTPEMEARTRAATIDRMGALLVRAAARRRGE